MNQNLSTTVATHPGIASTPHMAHHGPSTTIKISNHLGQNMSIPPKENITLCKMQHAKSQYTAFHGSMAHQAFQKRNGIDGKKYIPQHTEHCTRVTDPPSQSLPSNLPHIFSTFHDLPSIPTDYTINAFMALNNKEDTLTQSQMLKASDAASFIKAQQSKIQGLQHMDNLNTIPYRTYHKIPTY